MTATFRSPIAVTATLLGLALVATGCSIPTGRCGVEDECSPIRMHDPFRHDQCVPPKGTDPGHFGYARPQWRVLDERMASCCAVTELMPPVEPGPAEWPEAMPGGSMPSGPESEPVPSLPEVESQRQPRPAPRRTPPVEERRRSRPANPFPEMSDEVLRPVEGPLRPTRFVIEPELDESDYWREP